MNIEKVGRILRMSRCPNRFVRDDSPYPLTSMLEPVLKASGLRKTYPSGDRRLEVLRGVDLTVAPGESVSVRGESGSGKSTLLHLLAGLDAPDAGEIRWAGSTDTGAG